MQVAILSARTGWHTSELCRALAERGHSGVVLPYEQLRARLGVARTAPDLQSAGLPLFAADAVLARIIPAGSLEQIIYRVDALHWLEERGVPVMNSPRAIERSVDKFYTDALLTEAGVPTPPTVVCETVDDAVDAVREMGSVETCAICDSHTPSRTLTLGRATSKRQADAPVGHGFLRRGKHGRAGALAPTGGTLWWCCVRRAGSNTVRYG
jgi:hypothetical protein